ncbi:MAG: hypothetical protein ACE5IW_09095 [bacterium]
MHSFKFNGQQNKDSESSISKWPTKRQLREKFWSIRKELLIYGTGAPEFAAAYKDFAQKFAKEVNWIEIVVKPDSSVTIEEITKLPIWLIGTPTSNSLLANFNDQLPMKSNNSRFLIAENSYSEEKDVYVISIYPNPLEPALPISVISGNSDAGIVDFLENFYPLSTRAGDFRVFREGQGIAFGFFKQKKDSTWIVDSEKTRNYLEDSNKIVETEHYVFIYHGSSVPKQEIGELAHEQERRINKLVKLLHLSSSHLTPFPKIEYHLYEHLEDKGLMTGNTDLSHFNAKRWQVHALFSSELKGHDFYSDARLIFSKLLGTPKSAALQEGLGIYFSKGWGKRGFRYWAKYFYNTGNANSLEALLDSKIYGKESYLFMRPLAGSFVEFLIVKVGWEKFVELYKSWPESGLPRQKLNGMSLQELEDGWFAYLDQLRVEGLQGGETDQHVKAPKFQKGFCYAHEGYQIYNGYLSRKSFESLEKLRSLGVEWISVSPFGYLRDRNRPGYFIYSFGAGAENDESIITAFYAAKKLGMGLMLKPHLLMYSRHWGWPGEINMKSEKDWQIFFKHYYSWIRHYALLAEMYQADILCIGVELVHATRGHEVEWRKMIAKIKQIYHGPLVYAANWGEEFETLSFWDDLDYIGLNCYYPLSNKSRATLEDLKNGAKKVLPKIENIAKKYQKPVLFTEIGFTSMAHPWKNPHEHNWRGAVVLEDQALAYRAMFEVFWDKPWFFGFYWWKWPTYLERGGKDHSGFTPNGKPAEEVVKEWYLNTQAPAKPDYFYFK